MPDLLFQIYEDDYRFERIWRNPRQYLNVLKRYNGVILPDFSLYRDMPLVMQLWNIYRSRAIGFWLQLNGIKASNIVAINTGVAIMRATVSLFGKFIYILLTNHNLKHQ